jgi:hypothetical protein
MDYWHYNFYYHLGYIEDTLGFYKEDKNMEQEKTALELLQKLSDTVATIHLDMGGKHRYALSANSHPVLTEIKNYLYNLCIKEK